jgi:hypothetical protein
VILFLLQFHIFQKFLAARKAPDTAKARVVVTYSKDKKRSFDPSNANSYLSSNDWRILVGLGDATAKSIEIRWASGKIQKQENPAVNRYHSIKEGN